MNVTKPFACALLALAACGSQEATSDAPDAASDTSQTAPGSEGGAPPPHDGGVASGGDASPLPPVDGGLGPAPIDPSEEDPPSHGATITFTQIGAKGWYPSRRDPATGPCDALSTAECCLAKHDVTSDALTPWDDELTMTLRGPMLVKQLAVYQPASDDAGAPWQLVSGWQASHEEGITFDGDATPKAKFAGGVGSECLTDLSTAEPFACGTGSLPYCPAPSKHRGWSGSKLFVALARMPHAGASGAPAACSTGTTGNWYDAPWIGLAVGELSRAGAFASCQCFAKDPSKWYLADGCGQFNVFEVVNDNNQYKNLEVFSTNMIDYAGYVGQGPCGSKCDTSALAANVDLIDKTTAKEAAQGAVATPAGGPSAAFRRPSNGYRYFLIAMDVPSRTIQLGMIHPQNVPASIAALLPSIPATIPRAAVDAVLGLRLPK